MMNKPASKNLNNNNKTAARFVAKFWEGQAVTLPLNGEKQTCYLRQKVLELTVDKNI